MGQRGRNAAPIERKPGKNQRPGARARAELVLERSPAYWDLLLGDHPSGRRHWADWRDPKRKVAWRQWADRLRARWPFAFSCGRRPDAWWAFEGPGRLAAAWKRDGENWSVEGMAEEEIVYRIDADAAERADIEAVWRLGIEHARNRTLTSDLDEASIRDCAVELFSVPRWFVDVCGGRQ